MLKLKYWVLMTALLTTSVSADRIKDLADVAGVRSNKLIGFGLVAVDSHGLINRLVNIKRAIDRNLTAISWRWRD